MSQDLDPLLFPLSGTRLIEASAGTGKTWTIAALYLRLILGHGDALGFSRPLRPAEILVMTFTRAATKELCDRVRQRLVEAARCFRGEQAIEDDPFLDQLMQSYAVGPRRQQAAYLLALAAEAMDDAAIFTIDSWCQRMLREHAFDSGCLFDEELVASEDTVYHDAVRDYWRRQVYALDPQPLALVRDVWDALPSLEQGIRGLVARAACFDTDPEEPLATMIRRIDSAQRDRAAQLKAGWSERVTRLESWMSGNRQALNGSRIPASTIAKCFDAIREWAANPQTIKPSDGFDSGWHRLTPAFLLGIRKEKFNALSIPDEFEEIAKLHAALAELTPIREHIQRHAAVAIAARILELKRQRRQFGFADMLVRLREALEGANGPTLRVRILAQFPVALIDEFQDTSPDQYRIFDLLYRVADDSKEKSLLLIGDPKQAIYGFRGADIHSYLAARRATEGRHYRLGKNFRSTTEVVAAVNHLFLHAEGTATQEGHPGGAFRFATDDGNPLPFEEVAARGRAEQFVSAGGKHPACTIWSSTIDGMKADSYRRHFAAVCAETITRLLNDHAAGLREGTQFTRLKPADVAVLVRNKDEAAAVRRALLDRGVRSVYLSDKDSIYGTNEAADVLRWLKAVANPLDDRLVRAALATRTAGLDLAGLARLADDDEAWDVCVDKLKVLHGIWQRQGVLAMLRRFIHGFVLPGNPLGCPGGDRSLTDLLHLAELLQAASQQLDGEQALIRWLAEQMDDDSDAGDERILRLESDAELVKVVTVYKSKGLEYPLVFLPFAVTARVVSKTNTKFIVEYADRDGQRHIDFSRSDASLEEANRARLEEDLRLLYVALTRARHALWLGVTSLDDKIDQSAFGYLLGGGQKIANAALLTALTAMKGEQPQIVIEESNAAPTRTRLLAEAAPPELVDAPVYQGNFERNWSIASYTSITKDLGTLPVPITAFEEKILDQDDVPVPAALADAPWHRFPRGALPGQFIHAQLEWIAGEGFSAVGRDDFASRLQARCERAGWERRKDDTVDWLRACATTSLPPLGQPLSAVTNIWPEMEFWVPANAFRLAELDQLCQNGLLDGRKRPPLQTRQLHGMLRGFKDLVLESEGKYWVLDYKTNALGPDSGAYHADAMADAIAAHRYDVQGTIYLLSLHRLLRTRLGAHYAPDKQLGGVIFFFLRGIDHPQSRGCYHLAPGLALLDAADRLLGTPVLSGAAA